MRRTTPSTAFLGTGWSFPPKFSSQSGEASMVSAEEDIRQSLFILLRSRPGERVMQPQYGCDIYRYVFEEIDDRVAIEMRDAITQAILFFEPRIALDAVTVNIDNILEGKVAIEVVYTIRATNTRSNIVFPFYLREGTLVAASEAPGRPLESEAPARPIESAAATDPPGAADG